MSANTDPAAVANMARRREQLDEAQQLKWCECPARCPARKALEHFKNYYHHRARANNAIEFEVLGDQLISAALSAPCPCEEEWLKLLGALQCSNAAAKRRDTIIETLRRRIHQAERHNQFFERCESGWCNPSPKEDPATEGVGKAWKTPAEYEAERDSLRAENERLKRSLDWITAEKHGAQADAEREKNVADSLRAELAAAKEHIRNQRAHNQKSETTAWQYEGLFAEMQRQRDSLRTQVEEHQRWLQADSQHAENQRLRAELANVTTERNGYLKFLQQCAGALGVNCGSWEGRDQWMCAVEDALAASRLLREDKERLDWLEEYSTFHVNAYTDSGIGRKHIEGGSGTAMFGLGDSLRAAIDAAASETAQQVSESAPLARGQR